MRIVTRDDIQSIGDAASLMQFLDEKLGLPIPEGLGLGEIVADFSPYSLGLSGDIAREILSCQEISGASGEPSGIFLIRFRSEEDCSEVLRLVSGAPRLRGRNLADFGFICMGENYQPFAFAYFSDSAGGDWQNAELTVFSWTEAKTVVHTGAEHVLPDVFFPAPSPGPDDPPVTPGVNERPDDLPDPEDRAVVSYAEVPLNVPELPVQEETGLARVVSPSSDALLAKIDNTGPPLGDRWELNRGYVETGCNLAFVIDESKREQLIGEDAKSDELIKRAIGRPQIKRWQLTPKYLIFIPSGKFRQWPWSGRNESEAEQIFADEYPAIHEHLNGYSDKLKTRSRQGEFYWELAARAEYPEFRHPKIVYRGGIAIQAYYDTSGAFILQNSCYFIPTDDLSLLAILNGKLFHFYAQARYQSSFRKPLSAKSWISFYLPGQKSQLLSFPVAERTEAQKAALAAYVQLILDEPDSREVPALEEEIDALVYALYRLTEAERALIEEHR